jgi:2-methylcitrate dehydratase PrpD
LRDDEEVRKLVKILPDKSLDEVYPEMWSAIVEVRGTGGVAKKRVDTYPGRNSLNHAEVREKFSGITAGHVQPQVARRIVEVVDTLEELADMNELTELLREAG